MRGGGHTATKLSGVKNTVTTVKTPMNKFNVFALRASRSVAALKSYFTRLTILDTFPISE
jgi:hypothetical protein